MLNAPNDTIIDASRRPVDPFLCRRISVKLRLAPCPRMPPFPGCDRPGIAPLAHPSVDGSGHRPHNNHRNPVPWPTLHGLREQRVSPPHSGLGRLSPSRLNYAPHRCGRRCAPLRRGRRRPPVGPCPHGSTLLLCCDVLRRCRG